MDLANLLRIIVWALALLIGPPALLLLGVAAWDVVTFREHGR
jgi:hypothetical protein